MKIPCKNCITLPICLARTEYKLVIVNYLNKRCTLFREYSSSMGYSPSFIEIYDIFGLWNTDKKKRVAY